MFDAMSSFVSKKAEENTTAMTVLQKEGDIFSPGSRKLAANTAYKFAKQNKALSDPKM